MRTERRAGELALLLGGPRRELPLRGRRDELRLAVASVGKAVDAIERDLTGRSRAVALVLSQRRIAAACRRHEALIQEHFEAAA